MKVIIFWGIHLLWWVIWIVLMIWIFATPYSLPGERIAGESPIDILNKRFARGSISEEEYRKRIELLKGYEASKQNLEKNENK